MSIWVVRDSLDVFLDESRVDDKMLTIKENFRSSFMLV